MSDMLTTTIAEDEYVFQDKSLQLAKKFFDINDISLLKSGFFGYNTAIAAHMMRDGTFHRDMLYNEQFLITANLNSTLYNWSKTLDYDIDLAVPSYMPVAIKVPINDLERLSKADILGDSKTFTFSKEDTYDIGGFTFMLPHDVVVYFYRTAVGQLAVNASYDFSSYNYSSKLIITPYLKTFIENENGVDYVVIAADLFQIQKVDYITTMASNDILESSIIERNFGGNMASFQVFYNAGDTPTSLYKPVEMIFNDINAPKTDVYGYYTFIGSDTLRVYFSTQPTGFRPVFNSKVKLSIFTTQAEAGNFKYTGLVKLKDERFNGADLRILPLQGSTRGGTSIKSFEDTKKALIDKLKTRDNYTTTYDLETYFKEVKREMLNTESEYQVVKLRDDIFRRQFSLYVLQRNSDGVTIPSNTIDIELSLDKLQSMDYSIKPGTMIIYDRIEDRYRILDDDELPELYLNASDSYLYSVPFLFNVDLKVFPKTNIFYTNFNKTIPVKYNDFNIKTPYQIIINTFNLSRNPLFDVNHFNFSCFLNTDSKNIGNVKVRTILYRESDSLPVGYFDLDRVNSTSEFKCKVTTDDKFDIDGNYILTDVVRDINTGNIIPEFSLMDSYRVRIAVFIKDPNLSTVKDNLMYNDMSDLKDYAFMFDLDSEESISFAEDLTDIMYCETIINRSNNRVRINKLPVIGSLFYLNSYQNEEIMNDFYDSLRVVKKVSKQLENNTSIDVKFFNTYGLSRYFESDTIDLSLNIEIALNSTVTQEIDNDIKDSIVKFIENCNNRTDLRFSISNMITYLEQNFSSIRFIKIHTINGAFIQSVSKTKYVNSKTEDLPYDYVPEYLTVYKGISRDNNGKDFSYGIDIKYI